MIHYDQITEVHLEISSLCNARCPLCPRNFHGYPHNDGYVEANMSLASAKTIFNTQLLTQLKQIYINGNYGDAVMNPETSDIVEYFKATNPSLDVVISTNGSARDREFWMRLGQAKAHIEFCLDGLEDTHHLYRQNTNWQTIINNAKIFMQAGGVATWKMIKFDHNQHQLADCKQLSDSLGFSTFVVVDQGRNVGPVFDKQGNFTHQIGNYQGTKNFKFLLLRKQTSDVLLEDVQSGVEHKPVIKCYSQRQHSIYISSTGDVSPCCWLGFSPQTAGKGSYQQAVNAQIAPLVKHNNALAHPIEKCIAWFKAVEEAWTKQSFEKGRLISCNDNCGFDK